MLNISLKFLSSGISANSLHAREVTTPAPRDNLLETIPEVSVESADFKWCLPLRYSGLPLRRKLLRLMLTLQKYDEASGGLESQRRHACSTAEDYVRSVIDMAMLRGELRCRPSGAMTCTFLRQAEELRCTMVGVQQGMAQLRKEVRRITDDFLRQNLVGLKG